MLRHNRLSSDLIIFPRVDEIHTLVEQGSWNMDLFLAPISDSLDLFHTWAIIVRGNHAWPDNALQIQARAGYVTFNKSDYQIQNRLFSPHDAQTWVGDWWYPWDSNQSES